MRNKKTAALAAAIALFACGCGQSGANVVINVDDYAGIAFMMEHPAISASPIPIEPIYSQTGSAAEGTDPAESSTNTESTENAEQSSSAQMTFPVDDEIFEITWKETPVSGVMYVNTEGVSSRAQAIMGTEKANRFGLNQEVNVIAKTDTGYYKLDNETYLHSDYLSAEPVSVSTTITVTEPVTEPPQTAPRETEAPQTTPRETEPEQTVPITTAPPKTTPEKTLPPETRPPVTAAPETKPPATVPPITEPPVTETEVTETSAPEQSVTTEDFFQQPFEFITNEDPPPKVDSIYSPQILKDESEVNLKGIDVSWAQGNIDWKAVSQSGIDFAYIRVGRGDIDGNGPKADKYFLQNISEANKYGIDVGVYFYSYALTEEDAREEARLTIDLIKNFTVSYPVVYDLEEWMDRSNLADIAKAYMDTIIDAGYFPMLYSYRYGIDGHFSKEFTDTYALWVAQRNTRPETEYDYYIWQYSFTGEVDGIKGHVDLDISMRDFPAILKKHGLNKLSSVFS